MASSAFMQELFETQMFGHFPRRRCPKHTGGASAVSIVAAVNGILSTAGVDTPGSFGDLTVAAGVTGLARYTLMFSSATAYVFTRTA
jgi:hypothetical protein